MTERPYCEICGENHATLKTVDCAVCDDCFGPAVRADVHRLVGGSPRCCQPLRNGNGTIAMCMEVVGTEHDHQSMVGV